MAIDLHIVTPERTLVDCVVESVVAPGAEGEFGVLAGHEPFLAPLQAGEIRFRVEAEERAIRIGGGFAEVTQSRVTVLAQEPEASEPGR